MKKSIALLICILLLLSITFPAAAVTTKATQEKPISYSVFITGGNSGPIQKASDNPNDIITPYVEKKFNIKVKDVRVNSSTQSTKEAFSLFSAAGNIPDVMICSQQDAKMLAATGQFADLTSYVKDMPNYNKYIIPSIWARWATNGKHYVLPGIVVDANDAKFTNNPYIYGNVAWHMWMREDILAKCGYKFKPMADIAKTTTDVGKVPTMNDLKIEPAIDTPDKFVAFLKKVKGLNLKVGERSVVPFSSASWSVFHISTMFDNGHWRINNKKEVDGYLGLPGAKPFYKLWGQLYQQGLIDKDYITQKDSQLQEKVANGLVACGLYVPDLNAAKESNLKRDPKADLRPVIWPKANPKYGFADLFENGFNAMVINKDFKDIKRLTKYIDWFYSDEGQDILSWGPESAGLWEMKNGKKQFKANVASDIINNNKDGKSASYYGIWDPNTTSGVVYSNKAAVSLAFLNVNIKDYRLSYPIKLDMYQTMQKVFGKNLNCSVDYKGISSYGDGGANTTALSGWYWSKFTAVEIARILQSKNDPEFNSAWDIIYKQLLKDGKYKESKADMIKWFKEFGSK